MDNLNELELAKVLDLDIRTMLDKGMTPKEIRDCVRESIKKWQDEQKGYSPFARG